MSETSEAVEWDQQWLSALEVLVYPHGERLRRMIPVFNADADDAARKRALLIIEAYEPSEAP